MTKTTPTLPPHLQDLLSHVRTHSPYYRALYASLPPTPEIPTLASLPLTDPTSYWTTASTDATAILTAPLTDALVMRSGGSTSTPKTVYMTRAEFHETSRIHGALFPGSCAIQPGDRIANLSSQGGLYSGFMTYGYTVMNSAVPVVNLPISGKEPPASIEKDVNAFAATVVISNVFIATKLATFLKAAGRRLESVRLVLYTGEPFYADLRALYAAAFPNAVVRPMAYASVECKVVGFPVPGLNEGGDGDVDPVYRVVEEAVVLEIVGDDGHPVRENGVRGTLVVTNLLKRLQPTIRYPVGDVGEWVDFEQGLFRLRGRSDVGVKVGTALLDRAVLRRVVSEVLGEGVADSFQTVLRREKGRNVVVFRVAAERPEDGVGESIAARLEEAVAQVSSSWSKNREAGHVAPVQVEWVRFGELVFLEASGKLREVVDERY
ncbi:AMP-dependent synthetase/ligase [Aspergillus japonicus CBS 114.51]|uniref:AMP-dependent synthetase/ligase n=2 Tax=Aspergillus TaxID=5052 RepID=A0A2V5GZF7_ASPV1|nr:AMP-dependent synthetase/ligase [Aspergillus japonicus CBS 114.51]PYI16915.1 AMP-dependent synthetase/ligase [Aspergillus violaceofuscus CBS 115571]RAH76587.1 AMP-dependent synthetase/ligase [Aspergillus japonicus CBS 114.51]